MAKNYEKLSPELSERIREDIRNNTRPNFAAKGSMAIRRDPTADKETVWRGAYARDVDKIMYSPFYNRYTDKTQVFSFYKNDDITRRALHVQLVSRIARSIGSALNLNLDLIEAIALATISDIPPSATRERSLSPRSITRRPADTLTTMSTPSVCLTVCLTTTSHLIP